MRLLLDTHAWLWFVEGDSQLSVPALNLIQDPANDVFVSRVSFFEAAIKHKIDKLSLTKSLHEIVLDTYQSELVALNLNDRHIARYETVAFADDHRDPFDRMLLATALAENAGFITRDDKFGAYRGLLPIFW